MIGDVGTYMFLFFRMKFALVFLVLTLVVLMAEPAVGYWYPYPYGGGKSLLNIWCLLELVELPLTQTGYFTQSAVNNH